MRYLITFMLFLSLFTYSSRADTGKAVNICDNLQALSDVCADVGLLDSTRCKEAGARIIYRGIITNHDPELMKMLVLICYNVCINPYRYLNNRDKLYRNCINDVSQQ